MLMIGWIYLPVRLLILPGWILCYRISGRWLRRREAAAHHAACARQMIDFLESLSAHLRAGYNPYDALYQTKLRMEAVYGKAATISRALDATCRDYEGGRRLEQCLSRLNEHVNSAEMAMFISHFGMGIRQGCNLAELTAQFAAIFSDEHELSKDRRVAFSGAIREQNILLTMPIILLSAMRIMGLLPGGLSGIDIAVRAICLGIFTAAWQLSRRITGGADAV